MVFSLVGMMIIARYLPTQDFGAFILTTVMASFLSEISGFGLSVSLSKFIADTQEETYRRKLFNTALYFQIAITIIVSLIAFPLREEIASLFGTALPSSLIIFVPILFFLQSTFYLLHATLQGFYLFKKIGMSDFINSVLNFVLTCLFVFYLKAEGIGLLYAKIISALVVLVYLYGSIPIKKRIEFYPNLLTKLLRFGFPLHINDILSFIFNRIDTVTLGVLLGPTGVAYYEIARKIPDHIRQLYEAFRSVYFPLISRSFAEGEKEKAAQMLNNALRLISFATITSALITLLFGEEIVILLFSEQYLPSVPAFVILMVALNLGLIGYTLGISVVAVGDSDKPAIVNVVHTLASLISNLLLIPALEIVGAALASLIGIVATNPLDVMFLRRRHVTVKVMNYLKPILIFCVHALIFLLIPQPNLLHKILISLAFFLSSFSLSAINLSDLSILTSELKPLLLKPLKKLYTGISKS